MKTSSTVANTQDGEVIVESVVQDNVLAGKETTAFGTKLRLPLAKIRKDL